MDLLYKPHFDIVKNKWDMFWKGENKGRPIISIETPKAGTKPVEKPEYTAGAVGDFKPVIDQLLAWAGTHDFIGEAIPYFYVEFGPDMFSSFLGTEMRHDPNTRTSWCIHHIKDWDNINIKFRPESYWWERTVNFIRELRLQCDGKLMLAAPTLIAGVDSLVAMRGAEDLLMDMLTEPESIKYALKQVCAAYKDILEALQFELGFKEFGSITRHGMYSSGTTNVPQCDSSCMFSPEMYKEFEIDCLNYECNLLDAVEYHLDGPGALCHVPTICSIDKIDVIQWMPGAGEAGVKDWTQLHKEIDSYGKGQIITGNQEKVKKLCRELKSNKLFFKTEAKTKEEALRFIEEIEKEWR